MKNIGNIYRIRVPKDMKPDVIAHWLAIDVEDVMRVKADFYTPEEVAVMLHINPLEVGRRITEGRLVAHNFGGGSRRAVWRISPADLADYIARSRQSA